MGPLFERATSLAVEGMWLAVKLSLPCLVAAAVSSVVVGALQSWTGISEPGLGVLPRLVFVGVALVLTLAWMSSDLQAFAVHAFSGA